MTNNKKKHFITDYLKGFTIPELLTSLVIIAIAFLGIMILFSEVTRNYAKDQIMEDIRFNLRSVMDNIVEEIKTADSIKIDVAPMGGVKIELWNNGRKNYYSSRSNKGILYNGEKIPYIPGYYLFDKESIYEVIINDFGCDENALTFYDTRDEHLRNNFYDLTVEFKLLSKIDADFERNFIFKERIFTLNKYVETREL